MLHRRFNEIVQLHWELVKTEDRLETYIRPTKKKKKESKSLYLNRERGKERNSERRKSLSGEGVMHVESRIIFCEIISLFGFGAIKLMWTDSNGMALFLQLCLR